MIEINSPLAVRLHSCIDSSPSLARALSLLCMPHGSCATPLRRFFVPMPASTPPRCCRQARSSRVSAGKCPTPLSRPLRSPATASSIALLRASRSSYRGNPHAHCPAMPDVPTHAPPLRSPCPFSFIMTSGNAFEWRKIRRIYHAWSQAVNTCTG
jgi:hypothetical protein